MSINLFCLGSSFLRCSLLSSSLGILLGWLLGDSLCGGLFGGGLLGSLGDSLWGGLLDSLGGFLWCSLLCGGLLEGLLNHSALYLRGYFDEAIFSLVVHTRMQELDE